MAAKTKKEEIKVEETVVEETVEQQVEEETTLEVVEESKLKTTMSKVGAGIKKHGKKIAAGVAIAAVGLIGIALAKKSGGDDYDYGDIDLDSENWNIIDLDGDNSSSDAGATTE